MNRLSDSASLYLRQHADNPVHWHPWDKTALANARDQDRPILLSIGYSACHWCHVMAHESFEDDATAQVMNDLFTCIKVDREERPDLDKTYQLAHQLLTGRGGGWPLTVFLDPHSLAPFFAGTYFPPSPRHGMPAFADVLRRVRAWFDGHRAEVTALNDQVATAIGAIQKASSAGQPGADVLESAATEALTRADRRHGGFGAAPKFPQAPLLAALPELARVQPDLLVHLDFSLEQMSRGGLRDQLDGGFFRYTVDGDWTIPHFEKMLYDNALLLPLYAEAARRTGSAWLATVARGIAGWMTDCMRQANGGFASSMDADAEGREGGYHVWRQKELAEILDAAELDAARQALGLDGPPNFEGEAWHLTRRSGADGGSTLERALEKLLQARQARVPPATDYKQLAAWNALCVDGFARAGEALGEPGWVDTARSAWDFIVTRMVDGDQLFAVYADERAAFPAYLDDHAYLLRAALSLLEARWDDGVLSVARRLATTLMEQFLDADNGGFHFTAAHAEAPLHRLRVLQDDATPSGNGVAAHALLRLGHLCAEPTWVDAAQRLLASADNEMRKYPLGHASLLQSLGEYLDPPAQVIIRASDPAEAAAWKAEVRRHHRVHCYLLDSRSDTVAALPREEGDDGATRAYVCQGYRCLPAVTNPEELAPLLQPGN